MAQPIAIYGGSFDPIHYGHLQTANEVKQLFAASKVILIPCKLSPHKQVSNATPEQRYSMVKIACEEFEDFVADDREINSNQPSYTVYTLESIREKYPNEPLLFIMGMDSLLNFNQWHQWQRIFTLAHIVVNQRPGYTPNFNIEIANVIERRRTENSDEIKSQQSGRIYFMDNQEWHISATAVRENIFKNNNLNNLLPKSVEDYIVANNLYR